MIKDISRWKTPMCYLLLTLTLTGISTDTRSASWFDKLKEKLGADSSEQALGTDEIAAGLKEALRVATENTVASLGKTDGFNLDPEIHIPLPDSLEPVRDLLGKVGMDAMLTDLELRLNRAAESATPAAKTLFIEAINELTLDDVMAIYQGPDDAATQYLKSRMSAPLAEEMRPVIEESLKDAGAVKVYDDVMARYRALPFVPEIDAELSDYVVRKGMDGIFHYVAREEAAIRADPVKRTTELLQRVFGS